MSADLFAIRKKLSLHAVLRGREIRAYAADAVLPMRPGPCRAVIFAQGRTGSTLLESLLSSTGAFEERGEILNSDTREIVAPLSFVRGEAKRAGDSNFIFHVKLYHLTDDRRHPVDPRDFLRSLHDLGFRILALRRTNVARHVMSNLIANARGAYHLRGADRLEVPRIRADIAEVEREVRRRLRYAEEERHVLRDLPALHLEYERDLEVAATHEATVRRVMDFLSLESRPCRAATRRINTFRPEDFLLNHADVLAAFDRLGIGPPY